MAKTDKKRIKLQARIDMLEAQLRNSLAKKDSATVEINVPAVTRQLAELRGQLEKL